VGSNRYITELMRIEDRAQAQRVKLGSFGVTNDKGGASSLGAYFEGFGGFDAPIALYVSNATTTTAGAILPTFAIFGGSVSGSGGGAHQWGPGGTSPMDTSLSRSATSTLNTPGGFIIGGHLTASSANIGLTGSSYLVDNPGGGGSGIAFQVGGASALDAVIWDGATSTDTHPRWTVLGTGIMAWGAGGASSPVDTTLRRSATSTLQVRDNLAVSGSLSVTGGISLTGAITATSIFASSTIAANAALTVASTAYLNQAITGAPTAYIGAATFTGRVTNSGTGGFVSDWAGGAAGVSYKAASQGALGLGFAYYNLVTDAQPLFGQLGAGIYFGAGGASAVDTILNRSATSTLRAESTSLVVDGAVSIGGAITGGSAAWLGAITGTRIEASQTLVASAAFSAAATAYLTAITSQPTAYLGAVTGTAVATPAGGHASKMAMHGGVIYNYTTDAPNAGSTMTDLYSDAVGNGLLGANGDKITAYYAGTAAAHATNARTIHVSAFGTTVLAHNNFTTVGFGQNWRCQVDLIRVSSSVVRYSTMFTRSVGLASSGAGQQYGALNGEITGLTLTNAQTLKVSVQAATTGEITAQQGRVSFEPAAV
jgi:hypothetical protein